MSGDVLEVLSAEREIRRQLHTYCRAIDRLDVDTLKSVWHADGTLSYPDLKLQGAASDLADKLVEMQRLWSQNDHQLTNQIVEINGDCAASETHAMIARRSHPGDARHFVDSHSRYRFLDRWSRRDDRWAIDHRTAVISFTWVQPISEEFNSTLSPIVREDPADGLFASVGEPGALNVLATAWLERRRDGNAQV